MQNDRIALIERHRGDLHYFTFPGGHIDEGEKPEQTAIRETMEELGLEVVIKKLVARMSWQGKWQYYFLVTVTGGTFGTGTGEEMHHPSPERGTYHPIWMPLKNVSSQPLLPHEMADLLQKWVKEGWPEQTVVIPEETR